MIRKYLWKWFDPINDSYQKSFSMVYSRLDQNDGEIRNLIYQCDENESHTSRSIIATSKLQKELEKLVDRVTQLESTVQCLSNENQKLMGMIYSKSTVNEILKGE